MLGNDISLSGYNNVPIGEVSEPLLLTGEFYDARKLRENVLYYARHPGYAAFLTARCIRIKERLAELGVDTTDSRYQLPGEA